jgi:hypothetical protein
MSERDNQESDLDAKHPSTGAYLDATSFKLRGKNWINCPICKRKLLSQKEIKQHFKNHRKKGKKKETKRTP